MDKITNLLAVANKNLSELGTETLSFSRRWKQLKTDYESLLIQVSMKKEELAKITESIRTAYSSQDDQIAKLFKSAEEKSAAADVAQFKARRMLDEAEKSHALYARMLVELEADRAAFGALVAQHKEHDVAASPGKGRRGQSGVD